MFDLKLGLCPGLGHIFFSFPLASSHSTYIEGYVREGGTQSLGDHRTLFNHRLFPPFLRPTEMEANDHFNFTGLPPAPAASGLKPSPSSGEGLYTNGSPMNFPQQGKSKYGGHRSGERMGTIRSGWQGETEVSLGLATA